MSWIHRWSTHLTNTVSVYTSNWIDNDLMYRADNTTFDGNVLRDLFKMRSRLPREAMCDTLATNQDNIFFQSYTIETSWIRNEARTCPFMRNKLHKIFNYKNTYKSSWIRFWPHHMCHYTFYDLVLNFNADMYSAHRAVWLSRYFKFLVCASSGNFK